MAVVAGTAIPLVGSKGPEGDQGQATPALGSLCFAAGPQAVLSNVGGSANGVVMGVSGSTAQPCNYYPSDASAFLGATLINFGASNAAFSFSLVNVTAGTTLYTSGNYATGTVSTVGVFSQAAYPMAKGAQYQWRCNGAGTVYACVQPYYAMAANTSVAASQVNDFYLGSNVTLSGTVSTMALPGTASTAYIRLPRAGYLYTYNVANNSGSAVSLRFVNFTSTATLVTQTIAANSVATFGPFGPATAPLLVNTNYGFQVTGSGPADLQVQASVVS